jgi:hypothetical protein
LPYNGLATDADGQHSFAVTCRPGRHQWQIPWRDFPAAQHPMIEEFPQDVLAIYDRGYASYAVAYLHILYGSHCVIRLPKTFGAKITDFIQSNENERIIE